MSHLDQCTDGVEGSGSASHQMGLVVLLQDFDVVCTFMLLEKEEAVG